AGAGGHQRERAVLLPLAAAPVVETGWNPVPEPVDGGRAFGPHPTGWNDRAAEQRTQGQQVLVALPPALEGISGVGTNDGADDQSLQPFPQRQLPVARSHEPDLQLRRDDPERQRRSALGAARPPRRLVDRTSSRRHRGGFGPRFFSPTIDFRAPCPTPPRSRSTTSSSRSETGERSTAFRSISVPARSSA